MCKLNSPPHLVVIRAVGRFFHRRVLLFIAHLHTHHGVHIEAYQLPCLDHRDADLRRDHTHIKATDDHHNWAVTQRHIQMHSNTQEPKWGPFQTTRASPALFHLNLPGAKTESDWQTRSELEVSLQHPSQQHPSGLIGLQMWRKRREPLGAFCEHEPIMETD